MDTTQKLSLPYIMAAQAQKHITHNEAIRALDAVVQLGVEDRDLTAPPGTPANGDNYIVAAGAAGAWAGKDNQVAAFQDNTWMFYTPQKGWLAWISDEIQAVVWNGSAWQLLGSGSINPAALVGVNTTADATNKLAVKSDAVLFCHDNVTPGTGDQRTILNKATAANTSSILFQNNFSGRAEFGLTGDDDFHLKVSADGSNWTDALSVDNASGGVSGRFFDSQQLIIGYNSVGTIQPPSKGGIVFLSIVDATFPQTPTASILAYDVGSSPLLLNMVLGPSVNNLTTTTLTGTTGTDGEIAVAVDSSGNFYIENRFIGGVSRQFCLTFINSYREL